ncbi:MAG: cytochrome b/b6 domain-containing protein [Nitrococcus sp.]|nr:cytochrome b/b6 domain-containing protein [Nitrococcus sp.]
MEVRNVVKSQGLHRPARLSPYSECHEPFQLVGIRLASPSAPANSEAPASRRGHWFYRHPLQIRITHWVNVVALVILLMSGLQIFNLQPASLAGSGAGAQRPARNRAFHLESLQLRFPKGEAAKHYNVLQKISYVIVVLALLPLMLLAGLLMSPWFHTGYTPLLTLFDGRQSARTIHFIVAFLLVAFMLIHVFMVIVSGLWNNVRSMITGRYRIPESGESHDAQNQH